MYKILFIILGLISTGLGIIGIFVPGLPTTPFLLLAAALFFKSSEKLYKLLVNNKYIGHYITDFQKNKGLTQKIKLFSIALMWIMILTSVLFFIHSPIFKIILLIVGIIGNLIMGFIIPTAKGKTN